MGKADSDKQGDADVLRARDIVRLTTQNSKLKPKNSKLRMPGAGLPMTTQNSNLKTQNSGGTSSQNQRKQSSENIILPPAEKKAERPNDVPTEAADAEQRKRKPAGRVAGKIPKFDLAEQILAEQRKIAAMRRKAPPKAGMTSAGVAGPGRKAEAPSRDSGVQSVRYTIQAPPMVSGQARQSRGGQEQIIAEIVARDIEKLCGGNA